MHQALERWEPRFRLLHQIAIAQKAQPSGRAELMLTGGELALTTQFVAGRAMSTFTAIDLSQLPVS